jgi:hypothetical protein
MRAGWMFLLALCCAASLGAQPEDQPVASEASETGGEARPEAGAETRPEAEAAISPAGQQPYPLTWSFTGELTLRPDRVTDEAGVYDRLNTSLLYQYRFFQLVGDISLARDERYVPEEPYTLGRTFYIENAGLAMDFDFLSLKAGRFQHHDIVESPYSLFISSADHWGSGWATGLSALEADIILSGGGFSYESRWIELNYNSAQGYPDRGANYKVFSVEIGDFRFGLQDSAVYYGRVFDAEYFLSPAPNIITQMVIKRDSTPWQESANDNSITGLFAEWRPPKGYAYAQWLVDDISLDFLIPWFLRDTLGYHKIANKWAWSVGGYWDLSFGRLGFYHAGATEYTFEPTNVADPYGYTYYPAATYNLDGTTMVLDPQDNYLGYKYGENNLAFRVELTRLPRRLLGADFGAALEYVISGSKSPSNPWHGEANPKETRMLDDPVLEHTIVGELAAAWPWRGWSFYTRLRLGGAFNRLEEDGTGVYRPQAGENAFLYAWTVGFTYRTGWRQSRPAVQPRTSSNQPPESR